MKILISLTDGFYRSRSKKSDELKAEIVEATHSLFNHVIAIGYGSSVSNDELVLWASENNSYLLDSIKNLEETVPAILASFEMAE